MSKHIKFTLIKSLIVNTVKNETFKRGQVSKAADERNTIEAYHEQAGDEEYHERLLARGYYTNVELLKTHLADYLDGSGNLADDPLVSDEEKDGTNTIILKVNDRFNDGFTKSLARLCSRFIEDSMIADWYAVIDGDKSAYFTALAGKDLAAIHKSFSKTAPTAPTYRFPTSITLRYPIMPDRDDAPGLITPDNTATVDTVTLYANPWILSRGDLCEISYVVEGENGEKPIDDIVVRCDNHGCVPAIMPSGQWCVKAVTTGFTIVTLYSRHNDKVFASFAVRVV